MRSDVRIERATCGRARPKLCVCGPGAGQSTFSNIPTFDPVMPVPRPNLQLALDLELVSALFIPARFRGCIFDPRGGGGVVWGRQAKVWRAHSRLYQSRFLQVDTLFSAFFCQQNFVSCFLLLFDLMQNVRIFCTISIECFTQMLS